MRRSHSPLPAAARMRPWEAPLYIGVAVLFFSHFADWRGHEEVCSARALDPGTGFLTHLALTVALLVYAYFWAPERTPRWTSVILGLWAAAGVYLTRVYWMPRTAGPWMAAAGWLLLLVCAVWGLFVPRINEEIRIERKRT